MKKEPNKIGSFLMNADKYVILSRKTAMLNDRLEMLVKEIKRADRATLEKIIEYIEKCLRL